MNSVRNSRIKDCFSTTLGTDVLGYVLISLIVFVAIGLLTIMFFETIIPEDLRVEKYTHALDPLNFILSFIFYTTWRGSFEGYSSGPTTLRKLWSRTMTLSDKLFTFHIKRGENAEYLDAAKEGLIALLMFGYRLFSPMDEVIAKIRSESYRFKTEAINTLLEAHKPGENGVTVVMIRDIVRLINRCIKHAEEADGLTIGDTNSLTDTQNKIYDVIEELDVSFTIREPPAFNTHNIITLTIYFAIWLPFVMWITIGYWPTVVAYPIAMFLLSGVMIYRIWMGDAFDPFRPVRLHNFDEWMDEGLKRIEAAYKGEISHKHGWLDSISGKMSIADETRIDMDGPDLYRKDNRTTEEYTSQEERLSATSVQKSIFGSTAKAKLPNKTMFV